MNLWPTPQTIETAPRDGTRVLLINMKGDRAWEIGAFVWIGGRLQRPFEEVPDLWAWRDERRHPDDEYEYHPTHWLHLPTAPEKQT